MQTWDFATKATADKNAKEVKKRGAKNVKVTKRKDRLGRTYYRLTYKI